MFAIVKKICTSLTKRNDIWLLNVLDTNKLPDTSALLLLSLNMILRAGYSP